MVSGKDRTGPYDFDTVGVRDECVFKNYSEDPILSAPFFRQTLTVFDKDRLLSKIFI